MHARTHTHTLTGEGEFLSSSPRDGSGVDVLLGRRLLPVPESMEVWLRPLLLKARFMESIRRDPSERLLVMVGGDISSAFFFCSSLCSDSNKDDRVLSWWWQGKDGDVILWYQTIIHQHQHFRAGKGDGGLKGREFLKEYW